VIVAGFYYLYENTDIIKNILNDFSPDTSMTAQVSSILEEDGFSPLGIKDGLIMFKTDTLKNLSQRMYDTAFKIFNSSKHPLKLEAYYLEEPIIGLDFNSESDAVFEDLRSSDVKIEYDLATFDALVYSVSVDSSLAKARIEYFGTKEYFWKDYLGMCLVMVEDAPEVDTITLEYIINDSVVSLSISSEDVLKLYSGEISLDDFVGNVHNSTIQNDNVNSEKSCPLSSSEAKTRADEAYAVLQSYMNKGEGEAPEAQEAYADYKFYRDCSSE
jgi:hypothetical protein